MIYTEDTPHIDFSGVHKISNNVFYVRRHTLRVERKRNGSKRPIYEIYDLTEGTGPHRLRAAEATLKPPAYVGKRLAWAAQAFAISQGWITPKGGKL